MMQSCASAAKLRSGGPILPIGMKAKGHVGIPATSNHHRRPVTSERTRPKLSRCLQHPPFNVPDANRRRPVQRPPERAATGRSEACAPRPRSWSCECRGCIIGAGSKPLRQGAVLLEHEQPPRQLNHASSNPSIARTGQPFLPAFLPALVGRASEAGITR